MSIADKIKKFLTEQGKTLSDLELTVGVDRRTVNNGMQRKSSIAAVAYYLGITAEELVDGTEAVDVWYK